MTPKNRFCTTVQDSLTHRSILLSCLQAKQSFLPRSLNLQTSIRSNSVHTHTHIQDTVFQPENTIWVSTLTHRKKCSPKWTPQWSKSDEADKSACTETKVHTVAEKKGMLSTCYSLHCLLNVNFKKVMHKLAFILKNIMEKCFENCCQVFKRKIFKYLIMNWQLTSFVSHFSAVI